MSRRPDGCGRKVGDGDEAEDTIAEETDSVNDDLITALPDPIHKVCHVRVHSVARPMDTPTSQEDCIEALAKIHSEVLA